MTDTKQPEALRLAAWLSGNAFLKMTFIDALALGNELRRQHAEIERLTACLRGANSQVERFDREWYLRGDETEDKDARIAALEAENRALKGEMEAIGAGGVTGLRDSVPCWPQLYQAWQRVGADTALLDWREFVRVACQNPYAAIAQEGGK